MAYLVLMNEEPGPTPVESLPTLRFEDSFIADRPDYGQILDEIAMGFALHEMIFDAEGRALDYRFLDANPAYEGITGLAIEKIRGRTARELMPEIEPRRIEAYGRLVLTGEPMLVTDLAYSLDRHFEVWAYRTGPSRFITLVQDVTARVVAEEAALKQAPLLRAVLGSVESAVAFKGLDGRYLGCNLAYEVAFGTTEAELIGKSDSQIFDPETTARVQAEDREIFASGQAMKPDQIWRKNSSGRDRLFERRKLPLAVEGSDVFGIAVFWRDISESVLYEKANMIQGALSQEENTCSSREFLKKAVDELESATGSELGFFSSLAKGGVSKGPQAWSTRTTEAIRGIGDGHIQLALPERWTERLGSGRPLAFNDRDALVKGLDLPSGHIALVRILLVPVKLEGDAIGLFGMANKASPYNEWDEALCSLVVDSAWQTYARKTAQERTQELVSQLDFAISAIRGGFETWYLAENRKVYDERWAALLGYSLSELPADPNDLFKYLAHPEDYEAATKRLQLCLSGATEYYEAEIRMRHRDGHWVWVLDRAKVVERGSNGEPLRLSGLMIDISSLVDVQEKLRQALHDKDILLQELFHRTKNSLQLIYSMLELKKQEVESSSINHAFENIQTKIMAMSLVQSKLYQGGDLSLLDLGEYIAELIELIKDSAPVGADNVTMHSDTMRVPVSVDAAIPCGLIVAELISNSLGHAFPGQDGGNIHVSVSHDNSEISIAFRDDGVGLPAGFDPRKSLHLGMRTIVGIGEEQLRGRWEFGTAERGFSCRLTFKDINYPKRVRSGNGMLA